MLEAYKVAIRISLIEGVTSGLGLISRHLKRTDDDAKGLQKRLDAIAKMGAISAGLAGAGMAGLAMFKGPLEEAKKYQTVLERFKQFGLGDVALADAQKFVAAQNIVGTSQRQMMTLFVEAQGVFRESGAASVAQQLAGAKLAAPTLARMNYAMRVQSGHEMSESTQMDLLRFVEQAGGLSSPQRFNSLMNAGFKAVQSSGGNVSFPLYRQFMSYAGTAAMSLSDRALFADLEPIIGEMKGRAGVGLRTASNRVNGVVKLPNQVAHDLVRWGIWDGSNIAWNNQGGIKSFIPNKRDRTGNPLIDSALLASSPVDFYLKDILPRYTAMGLTAAQRNQINTRVFGGTGGQLFANIDRFLPQILLSRAAFGKALGIDQAVASGSKTAGGKEVDLLAKEATLKLRIGQDILPIYVHGLELVASALSVINSLPDVAVKFGVLTAAGATLTAFAGSGVTALITGAQALDAALVASGRKAALMPLIGRALGIMMTGIRLAGAALIANPIGLTLTAIATAAFLLYENWSTVAPLLKTAWAGIKSGFVTFINGIIALANRLPFVHINPVGGAAAIAPPARHSLSRQGGDVYLDGKKVGAVMVPHLLSAMDRQAARPNQGVSGFDGRRAWTPPSLAAR